MKHRGRRCGASGGAGVSWGSISMDSPELAAFGVGRRVRVCVCVWCERGVSVYAGREEV